jgi:hypothetical protein
VYICIVYHVHLLKCPNKSNLDLLPVVGRSSSSALGSLEWALQTYVAYIRNYVGTISGLESYKVNVDEEEEIVHEFAAKTLSIFMAFKKDRTSTRWPWLILPRSKKCLYHSHRTYLITIFLSKVRRRLPSAPLSRPARFDSSFVPIS